MFCLVVWGGVVGWSKTLGGASRCVVVTAKIVVHPTVVHLKVFPPYRQQLDTTQPARSRLWDIPDGPRVAAGRPDVTKDGKPSREKPKRPPSSARPGEDTSTLGVDLHALPAYKTQHPRKDRTWSSLPKWESTDSELMIHKRCKFVNHKHNYYMRSAASSSRAL
jgi:hypothetical protein